MNALLNLLLWDHALELCFTGIKLDSVFRTSVDPDPYRYSEYGSESTQG